MRISFIFDISRSMLSVDEGKIINRLESAKNMISLILSNFENAEYSLTIFKGKSLLVLPFSKDKNSLNKMLNYIEPDLISSPGSFLGDAVFSVISNVQDDSYYNFLIILTDGDDWGENNYYRFSKFVNNLKLESFVVGIGGNNPVLFDHNAIIKDKNDNPVKTVINEENLLLLASSLKGSYYNLYLKGINFVVNDIRNGIIRKRQMILYLLMYQGIKFFGYFVIVYFYVFICQDDKVGRNFLAVLYACFLCLGFFSCSNVKSMSLMAIGNYEYVRGNYQNAISNYYNLVEDKKYSAWGYYNLGIVYYSLGEYESSLRIFSYAKKTDDIFLNFNVNYNEGIIYYNQGLYHKAEMAFKEALKINPSSYNAKYNLELAIIKKRTVRDSLNSLSVEKSKNFVENNENFLRYIENLERVVWLRKIDESLVVPKEDW